MPTTTAFAPTAADLAEFYFDPIGAAHADDDAPPPPAQPDPAPDAGQQG